MCGGCTSSAPAVPLRLSTALLVRVVSCLWILLRMLEEVATLPVEGRTPSAQERALPLRSSLLLPPKNRLATFSSAPLRDAGYQRWSGLRQ
jgi:hypothetical protein